MQKVAANRTRKFLPEEIDLALNKMVERFIDLRITRKNNGAFSINQESVDSIRSLIVTNHITEAFIDGDRYKSYLPPDYRNLISDSSGITLLCGESPVEETSEVKVVWAQHPFTVKTSPPYYEQVSVTIGVNTFRIPQDLPFNHKYKGYLNKEDFIFLIPSILQNLRRSGVS